MRRKGENTEKEVWAQTTFFRSLEKIKNSNFNYVSFFAKQGQFHMLCLFFFVYYRKIYEKEATHFRLSSVVTFPSPQAARAAFSQHRGRSSTDRNSFPTEPLQLELVMASGNRDNSPGDTFRHNHTAGSLAQGSWGLLVLSLLLSPDTTRQRRALE